jgi:hypothetical protein
MKLNLTQSLNVKSTVTDTPISTFHLRNASGVSELDKFFMNSANIYNTYKTTDNKPFVIAWGSDMKYASSEALAYFLNFYVELYIISKNNNNTTNVQLCITRICWVLNTIIILHQQNSDSEFKDVIFPMWYYNYDATKNTLVYGGEGGQGNATDMNIEMLKSLLKLYIFDYNNPYLENLQSTPIIPFTYDLLNIHIDSTSSVDITLKKFIVMMTYNFMWGGPDDDNSNAYGNFSSDTGNAYNNRTLCFWTCCGTNTSDSGSNLINNGFQDYVNFSCFIYLYKFYKIFGYDLTNLTNISINQILQDGNSTKFPSWKNTKYSINNYLLWLNTYISSNGIMNFPNLADQGEATFDRLSYQLVHLYILFNQGDGLLNISATDCQTCWSEMIGTTLVKYVSDSSYPLHFYTTNTNYNSIEIITTLCSNLICVELKNLGLKLELIKNDAITINNNSIYNPYVSNDKTTIDGYDPNGYYRQITYMCFKEIYTKIHNSSPSNWPSKRTDGTTSTDVYDTKYFENDTLDNYFGFSGNNTRSLQSIINTYTYINNGYVSGINYLGFVDSGNRYKAWNSTATKWGTDYVNDPYFTFSVCSLHQINYNLFKNPFIIM